MVHLNIWIVVQSAINTVITVRNYHILVFYYPFGTDAAQHRPEKTGVFKETEMAFGSAPRGIPRILQWLLVGLMTIIGLAVGGLGLKLATVGGSWYFMIMGVVMVISAILISPTASAALCYAIAFIASIFWAVGDAGWDFWPLFSRLFTFAVLAFLCAIVWPFLRAANSNAPVKKPRRLALRPYLRF
jgi:quinate dehydrogenase (quinone)